MAFREVTVLEVKEVVRRWLAGEAIKAITRKTGVSRNTVRSYIKAALKSGTVIGGGPHRLDSFQGLRICISGRRVEC
jgi:predicted transcriptional regulator